MYRSVVAIRDLAITLLELMCLALLVIFVGIFLNDILPKGPANSTDAALHVALNDSYVSQVLSRNGNQYRAEFRTINASSNKGFIDYPGNLTGVYIETLPPPPPIHFYFIIDTDRGQVVDRGSWLDLPPYEDVIIPPGTAWYHKVISTAMGFGGIDATPQTRMESSYTPTDANVSQFLVNEEGLHRLMNLSRVTPLGGIDVSKYVTVYNRSEMQGPKWNATIAWPKEELIQRPETGISNVPLYRSDDNYYIVVINRESSREVSLLQWAFTGSLW
jgi:hypothetical protein